MNILAAKSGTTIIVSDSPASTKKLGKAFANKLKPGDIVCLNGELGSGKTTFVQGLAEGFGIKDFVRSPSFTIINEYRSKNIKLYHVDLYRLGSGDIDSIGLEEYLYGGGVCVMEWAERIKSFNLKSFWKIDISWKSEKKRKIEIEKIIK
jgi:tRNA threonylcarbamoyladenosine biosynthesis protein TsaE